MAAERLTDRIEAERWVFEGPGYGTAFVPSFGDFDPQDDTDGEIVPVRPARRCPECRGTCEDKYGNPCEWCAGEGEI